MASEHNAKSLFVLTVVLPASVRCESDRRALHSCLFVLNPVPIPSSKNVWDMSFSNVIRTQRAILWSHASCLRGAGKPQKNSKTKQNPPMVEGEGRLCSSIYMTFISTVTVELRV